MTINNNNNWPGSKVRQTFVDFFCQKKDHTFVKSSPVVPLSDPTLLFTNAGMNQFKPIFLGTVDPKSDLAKLKRAANSQKCIRAGGKHNDLDDVGKDTYHHTFFEMLGNWSFGDYFKKEAIAWAWELLTEEYGLPKDRLYASYFGGDEKTGLPADEEARQIWLQYLPEDRVLPFGAKENFWEMGETGPCGPCSEIHFDRIGGRNAASLVNKDDPNVIEIWNNVFIQFNREEDGSLRPLPDKHVDTGMGLERITSILQGVLSNYDTDIFLPIFDAIQKATGCRPYTGKLGIGREDGDVDGVDTAYRVIADHIRTLVIAITDGAMPDAYGRGYVLRRIVRRAVRYGKQFMNAKIGFFHKLAPVVADVLGDAFPELRDADTMRKVMEVIEDEERTFGRTLEKGIKQYNIAAEKAINNNNGVIDGYDVFRLYDTYGFPVDLTQLMAEERKIKVDVAGFNRHMELARIRSQNAGKEGAQGKKIQLQAEQTDALKNKMNVQTTDDSFKYNRDTNTLKSSTLLAIFDGSNFVDSVSSTSSERVGMIFDRTNFYAEAGGQVSDMGLISKGTDTEFSVDNVQVAAGYVIHIGNVVKGEFRVGEQYDLTVDFDRRDPTAANHTATHMLNYALRAVLGKTVDQRGSLVAPDKLRFDFTNNGAVPVAKLAEVEKIVREQIKKDIPVYTKVVELKSAQAINTLRAVFGETYPDPVRVVSVGVPVDDLINNPTNDEWMHYAVEFCGGTHLQSSGQAEEFAIISEEAIAKGIRRIVALTKEAAKEAHENADVLAGRIAEAAKITNPDELAKELARLTSELNSMVLTVSRKDELKGKLAELQNVIKEAEKKAALEIKKKAAEYAENVLVKSIQESGAKFLVANIDQFDGNRDALQATMEAINAKCPDVPALLLSGNKKAAGGKVVVLASVPAAKINKENKFDAVEWIKETCKACDGKGGGKPNYAQGQGNDTSKVDDAAQIAIQFANLKL
eukprot:GEZU01017335.1.p1 GENE.GEZU01017335.1~~GEZU01017335.1.p1  ORF type:complete len:974 (-),score=426.07 GEZU01017335.1:139-3060(-)